jgi:thymidylate kinase
MARLAAATVPRPDLVICLLAEPEKVIARKPELSIDEIRIYQNKLQGMASDNQRCVILHADDNATEVLAQARTLLAQNLFKKC